MAYSIPPEVRIVFLDMDHTLIANDCDVSWKIFLSKKGLADWRERALGHWYYLRYRIGWLDNDRFMLFQLKQFRGKTPREMEPLLEEHFQTLARPRIYPAVFPLVDELKTRGIPCVLITSTCAPIARPLADYLKMDALIATELALDEGRYIGRYDGEACLGKTKITAMEPFAKSRGYTLAEAMYWGDSIHDIPILAACGFPIAANPDAKLRREAKKRGWQIVDFSAP